MKSRRIPAIRQPRWLVACFVTLAWCGGWTQVQQAGCVVHGSVRDAQGASVSGATVELRRDGSSDVLKTQTDASGTFRFKASAEGRYILLVEVGARGTASSDFFAVEAGKEKQVDLTLTLSSSEKASSTSKLEFDDQPRFTVAGVADTTNLGGHGSNATSSTKKELTRDAVRLGSAPTGESPASTQDVRSKETALREMLARDPQNFDANLRLGQLLADAARTSEGMPFVERALSKAEGKTATEKAAAYHVLAGLEEKVGKPLDAVRHYQLAAELDPSEANLFDWGAELLKHNAPEPATAVFSRGSRLHPESTRMLIALGVSWHARGIYDRAAQCMAAASDLRPEDPAAYMFLGKLLSVDAAAGTVYKEELGRFAERQPTNAWANYYYALSLWKQRKASDDARDLLKIQSLLEKATRLDPKLGEAFVLLGSLFSEQGDSQKAIAAFQKATEVTPGLVDAHYRLAQAYKRAGEADKGAEQLRIYSRLSKDAADQEERERREMRQFVYTLGEQKTPAKPD